MKRRRIDTALGLIRSLAVYYGIPWRGAQLRRLYAPFLPAGGLGFDIGSHLGNRVRVWRRLGARVVAAEPQPACVTVLRWLYGRDPGVVLVTRAVGAQLGAADLWISDRHPTVSTLAADWTREVAADPAFGEVRWRRGPSVPVTTLDALIAEHGPPDFVKIDVEGFELEVLRGLSEPVAALSFEYLPLARERALACVDRLEELGRHRYNWSVGETSRLVAPGWVSAPAVRAFLAGLDRRDRSGDIYARHRPAPGGDRLPPSSPGLPEPVAVPSGHGTRPPAGMA